MSIIWWTLYIIGAVTIIIVWINLLTIFIKGCNVILKKEWKRVKYISGPQGPQGPQGAPGRDAEFLITSDVHRLIKFEVEDIMNKRLVITQKMLDEHIRQGVSEEFSKIQNKEDK